MLMQPLNQVEGGGGGRSSDINQDQIYDLLAPDPVVEKEEEKEEKEKEGTPPQKEKERDIPLEEEEEKPEEIDEEIDELEEIEKELEGPTEEDLELVTPVRRKEILAKYPNIFKDFPYLEKAYYRDQQFTELLPTIEDAREAINKAQILDKYEQELLGGNTEKVLRGIKEEDPSAFNKIVDDYLPVLQRVDEKAFHVVIGNVLKHTIMSMIEEANTSKNDALKGAAHILNQFSFGSSKWAPPVQLHDPNQEKDPRIDEVKRREMALAKRQFEGARDDLNTRVENILKSTINNNIDPKKNMSEYVRKNASREALEYVQDLIDRDTRFRNLLDRLWDDAFRREFSRESIDRIRNAYLSRAKTLLPSVLKKARNEALKGSGKRLIEEEKEDESPIEKEESTPPSRSGQNRPKKGEIQKGESTMSFFMRD
jgi:hypothetical protein